VNELIECIFGHCGCCHMENSQPQHHNKERRESGHHLFQPRKTLMINPATLIAVQGIAAKRGESNVTAPPAVSH
jgi:hypothetical protein